MFFEKLKEFEERVEQESLKFVKSIRIPIPCDLPVGSQVLLTLHKHFQTPKQPKLAFEGALARLNHADKVAKTKSRLCGGILKRGDRAYKCHECVTEENSILCLGCFELDKHRGHQFQLISVFGGCCDCGDPEKWRPEGFCRAHSSHQQVEVALDEALVDRFLKEQHFAFKIALFLYGEHLALARHLQTVTLDAAYYSAEDSKRFRAAVETKARIYLQVYSSLYLQGLVEFNAHGQVANAMTERLFQTHLDLSLLPNVLAFTKGETNFFKLLFAFTEFTKTPQKVCDLCITLFQMPGFRETITVEYMTRYSTDPDFPCSNYSHLSSQLFTSYLAISSLVRQKRVPALSVHPRVEQPADLDDAAQTFVRYYYDINYLAKLYGEAAIEYFTYHAQTSKIVDLCDYRRLFNEFPKAKDFYGLEEIFVNRMAGVIQVAVRDRTGYIIRTAMRQLYQWLTAFDTKANNFYRPHERLFTLLAFQFLEGDLNRLEDDTVMADFIDIIGVCNLQQESQIIIQNICTLFSFSAHMIENQNRVNENFTFYSFYFKKNVTLFNLDAVLLKIVVKMCEHFNLHAEPRIDLSGMIRNGDRFFDIANKMMKYTSEVVPFGQMETTKQVGLSLEEDHIKHFVFYLSLLNEAITSDLPLLAIKCFLQPSKDDVSKHKLKEIHYDDQAIHYYSNILKSCENGKVQIKDFKAICDMFFKEEEVFKGFIKSHMDSNDSRRLDGQKSKGERVSLLYYRSTAIRAIGMNPNGSLTFLPYFYRSKTASFIEEGIIFMAKRAIDFVLNLQKALQAQNIVTYKAIAGNCIKVIFNFVWIVMVQTRNHQIYEFINKSLRVPQFKGYLQHLSAEIKNYSKALTNMEQQPPLHHAEIDNREQLLKREKLSNKRNLMRQKMNKNKDFFLPQEKSQKMQQQNEQQFCCLCKQNKQNEDNCFIAMFSETNYYPWAHLSPANTLYTVTSCGHEVHRTCYQKIIKKNQIYGFCPLCKKPMNIVIPKQTQKNNEESMARFWHEFHMINKNYNQEAYRKNQAAIVFLSLVGFTVIKGLLFHHIFKKELKVYRTLTELLRYCYQSNKNNERPQFTENGSVKTLLLKESNEQVNEIMKFIANELFKNTFSINYTYKPQNLSSQFIDYAKRLAKSLCSSEPLDIMEPELKQTIIMRQTIIPPLIQPSLSLFSSKYLGQCPNCSLVTNQQAVCLICPRFVTCIKCESVKLMAHSHNCHRSSCSFIKTHTGEVVYIYRNRFWVFESVFEDYMGRTYVSGANKAQYNLNQKKLQPYLDDVVRNGIEARLRYKEKQSNKVNHDQEL